MPPETSIRKKSNAETINKTQKQNYKANGHSSEPLIQETKDNNKQRTHQSHILRSKQRQIKNHKRKYHRQVNNEI